RGAHLPEDLPAAAGRGPRSHRSPSRSHLTLLRRHAAVRTLRIGEEVVDPDGRRLGSIERLVVDPTAHRVTHIVVLGRLVGVDRIADDGQGRLRVDLTSDGLRRLPEVHPGLVVPPGEHWHPPDGYVVENFLRLVEAFVGQSAYVPPVQVDLDTES